MGEIMIIQSPLKFLSKHPNPLTVSYKYIEKGKNSKTNIYLAHCYLNSRNIQN